METFWPRVNYRIGEGNGTPLQYSCLKNPMGGGAWWAAICGVAKSRTWLSDFTFTFHFHALEKEMASHSSVLAWRIPGTGEPGELLFMGWHRIGHDWSDLAAAANYRISTLRISWGGGRNAGLWKEKAALEQPFRHHLNEAKLSLLWCELGKKSQGGLLAHSKWANPNTILPPWAHDKWWRKEFCQRESRKDNGPADLYFPLGLQTSYSWRRQWHSTPVLFCLENPMDGGAWQASVHGVVKSRTRLSDFTFTFHFCAL